jgi:phosphate transport system protein
MREHFDKDIHQLKESFIKMGEQAQKVILLAVSSLEEKDIDKANQAIEMDDVIDQYDHCIENKCLSLIALQQPIAKDLRVLGSLIKIITDMERIGDYGVNIANVTLDLNHSQLNVPLDNIHKMSENIHEMLKLTMQSFMEENIELAKNIAKMDDEVDQLFMTIIDDAVEYIKHSPDQTKVVTSLMFVARHLERIADHTTNICERIIYMVTGELVEIN